MYFFIRASSDCTTTNFPLFKFSTVLKSSRNMSYLTALLSALLLTTLPQYLAYLTVQLSTLSSVQHLFINY